MKIDSSTEDDIRAVCEHHGIGNARAVDKLVKLGLGPLGLRMVADVIEQARLFMGERAIGPADINKTIAFMGVSA